MNPLANTAAGAPPGKETQEPGRNQAPQESESTATSRFSGSSTGPVSSQAKDEETSPRQRAPTACMACRTSHLKCDRQQPCSRCKGMDLECIYVASRRGYNRFQDPARAGDKRPRSSTIEKNVQTPKSVPTPAPSATTTPTSVPFSTTASSGFMASRSPTPVLAPNQLPSMFRGPDELGLAGFGLDFAEPEPVNRRVPLRDECMRAFYRFFHASHPFVLPEEVLLRFAAQGLIEVLVSVMRWVGSSYLYADRPSARVSILDDSFRLVYSPVTPRDAFLVQAMMLLVIGLDGAGQYTKGKDLLKDAKELAIEIGLNTRPFAVLYGQGVAVLEESWRRTWWELYILDGMFAGIHRVTEFTLFDLPADVALPCEESHYMTGVIPSPRYLDDLEESDFSDDESFSSLAYCILCARNLGRLLKCQPILGPDDENVSKIETLLATWWLCLPLSKRDGLGGNDEVMFKAYMIFHATSILLHYPLSNLDPSHAARVRSCTVNQISTSGDGLGLHTRHAIASANEVTRLVTHPAPLAWHTPFFTCIVALASILHLNRWGTLGAGGGVGTDEMMLRQRIRLNIGALGELAKVWGSAGAAREQVRGVAREIHLAKKQQQAASELWNGFVAEQLIADGEAEEGLMDVEVQDGAR